MNRLVIIGNGFDLAHGLPTSYGHFIDDFWANFKHKVNTEDYKKMIYSNEAFDRYYTSYGLIKNFNDFKKCIKLNMIDRPEFDFDGHSLTYYTSKFGNREKIFEFKNNFFKLINQKNLENWVDIENEYYKLLKGCLKHGKSIIELNQQFDEVKFLLEEYLKKNINQTFILEEDSVADFIDIFNTRRYIGEKEIEEFFLQISKKDSDIYKKKFNAERANLLFEKRKAYVPKIAVTNYFLSFNYTFVAEAYSKKLNSSSTKLIEIHGNLDSIENPPNFGFGDEMDRDYQLIEEINDNEYLKNIKSFQYLHTSNYKQLLDLIDSEKFQVYIMGHSCGLSDRTLLNTIFEHVNCCSIKIFYHRKKDGTDNYTEITQNMSRHFNKKALMRERIVNKTLCQPLPQIQLPKKE